MNERMNGSSISLVHNVKPLCLQHKTLYKDRLKVTVSRQRVVVRNDDDRDFL